MTHPSSFTTRQFARAFVTDPEAQGAIGRAKERFLHDPDAVLKSPPEVVRPEILQSWKRSLDAGVDSHGDALPPQERRVGGAALQRVVEAQRESIAQDLDGTNGWVMVMDQRCRTIGSAIGADDDVRLTALVGGARHGAVFREDTVGSNGAAVAIERMDAFAVIGAEHFQRSTHNLVTVGAAIRDPVGRVAGVVSLNARLADAHPVMLPLARGIARTISDGLLEIVHRGERSLFMQFMQSARRPSRPVLAVGDDVLMLNSAARQLLTGRSALDEVALRAEAQGQSRTRSQGTVRLDGGDYELRTQRPPSGTAGVIAKLARAHPRPETISELSRVQRARADGIPALIRGEHGSGRAWMVHHAADGCPVTELAAGEEADDGERWCDRLQRALAVPEAVVLIRDIDRLPERLRAVVLRTPLSRGEAWVAATAATDASDAELLDSFPVVVERSPLRQRRDEMPQLISAVLADLEAPQTRVTPEALSILIRHPWHGNFPRLRSVLATALASGGRRQIELTHLPSSVITEASAPRLSPVDDARRRLLVEALRASGGDREAAAASLGISRATVYRQLKRFGIRAPGRRR
ncbi:helix-turn-helix domain-containing protein [Citricoccus sp. GCM10030269]|uniref:helix-turn-helix domain-containing protein n=1 Tax=Citricoccus sp. GCM10030269 TaxID=3273388 RepID=UPI00360FBA47